MKNLLDINAPKLNKGYMSLKFALTDQINKLFEDSPELENIDRDRFEIAVANFATIKYLNGIDLDDLEDGLVGKGGDEGIDMLYIFCNGVPVKDDRIKINSDSTIKIKFFQAKEVDSFSTTGFKNLKEGIEEIFDFDLSLSKLKKIGANDEIKEKADLIRKLFTKAQREKAKFNCEVYYVTISPTVNNISQKILHLEEAIKNNSLGIPFKVEYWGGQTLYNLTKSSEEQLDIVFENQPLNISEVGIDTSGYAGFVRGNELMKSLIKDGEFQDHLTEGNVRYFLNEDKKINKSIIESAITNTKAAIFWALNNGVTILGEEIKALDNKGYTITNPQIVNGCQTIHCLYIAFSKKRANNLPDNLKVFVKLVKTNNPFTQTDIISATNSQNPVKTASLKANDDIQKNIEEHLKRHNIFYERRENFYKMKGKTGNKVVSLLKMAQIMQTVINKEAVVAANDVSTLFDTTDKYELIFNENADYDVYLFSTKLFQKVWSLKTKDLRSKDYDNETKDLIKKGGFIFLHIISSFLFSDAEIKEHGKIIKHVYTKPILISTPARKNEFSKRKEWLLEKKDDDTLIEHYYIISKNILRKAAQKYATETGKTINSLFKNRAFDKEYLRPEIDNYLSLTNKKMSNKKSSKTEKPGM